ncbi:hypothetical protein ACOI1H_25120, partial [Loktanella sp. DJP18]|uniref:hypothetical protein n=1 Tax=Loktanella sp. DJP18 TaxID=3409788 RepID=UPI003BB5A21A
SLVATVGGAEIRNADLMTFIGTLPPEVQSMPPEMLVPVALEQLILRELILNEANSQNLGEDPEVQSIVDSTSAAAMDDAMVQVWLSRQMADVVTDEAVQQVYDEAVAAGQQDLPPVEQVRPQIEQFLLQQAMQDVQMQLSEGAEVVFYDPTGQPVDASSAQTAPSDGASGDGAATDDTSSSEESSGDASGGEETDSEATGN